MTNNVRQSVRLQCGNSDNIFFTLIDKQSGTKTAFCICSDLSEAGAHFFTDQEFQPGQQLMLSIIIEKQKHRIVPVTVVRTDDHLHDEGRYCAAVAFDQSLKLTDQLRQLQSAEIIKPIAA